MNIVHRTNLNPIGRWFFNLLLIVVIGVIGLANHIELTRWEPVLCASKLNLQIAIDDSYKKLHHQQDFLADWDTGARPKIRGITRNDIVLGVVETQALINRQTDAFKAYQTLECKGDR